MRIVFGRASAIIGFGLGIFLFARGFFKLNRKRLIENLPTSTVRGLAMGVVELKGIAKETSLFTSPLTQQKCVLYKYIVEELKSTGRHGQWVVVASGDSYFCPFWLEDNTGKIQIFPKGTKLITYDRYRTTTDMFRRIPDNIKQSLNRVGIDYVGFLGNRRLRLTEWTIKPGENIYVLGTAMKPETSNDFQNDLKQQLEEIKKDPQQMNKIDTDKNGVVSLEEWDIAVANLKQREYEKILENKHNETPAVYIGNNEGKLTISNFDENLMTKKLLTWAYIDIFSGVLISLVFLAIILIHLKVL